jgi:hypothetical protein
MAATATAGLTGRFVRRRRQKREEDEGKERRGEMAPCTAATWLALAGDCAW